MGNKYGYRPIPTYIADELFTILAATATGEGETGTASEGGVATTDGVVDAGAVTGGEDWGLVEAWYRRDENANPPVYVLQAVSVMIPDVRSNVSPGSVNYCCYYQMPITMITRHSSLFRTRTSRRRAGRCGMTSSTDSPPPSGSVHRKLMRKSA